MSALESVDSTRRGRRRSGRFPYWLVIIIGFLLLMAYLIYTGEEYALAFERTIGGLGDAAAIERDGWIGIIGRGLTLTVYSTLVAFAFALAIGLFAGLGRVSKNTVIRTISITYVEFIRGVPTLVLIFTLAFVLVPAVVEFIGLENNVISSLTRGIIALALIYGAFLAEIFRAGIESVPKGQMEAARSLGMNARQAMRYIILPQAIRNILPALGNDFIAMLKDSSLLSVLAIRELTQMARVYAGSSFRFRETYLVLTFLYLSMTITLSLLVQWLERRLSTDER